MHEVRFRIMAPADIEAGLRLTRAAGWNQLDRDWEMFLEQSPEGCHVAEKAGKVIGTSATIRYQEHFSWIGMVLVDPAERSRGIGRRLLEKALETLAAERCVRLDATAAGEPMYRQYDFRKERGIRRMEAEAPGVATAPKTAQSSGVRIRPMLESDLPGISRLDFAAFGADRSFLLDWIWRGAPEYAWVIEGWAGIEAYMLGRRGSNFEHLGPIVAPSVEFAHSLVVSCLPAVSARRVIIDASEEPDWLKLLTVLGFREQRPFVRMYRGQEPRAVRSEAQWAFLGPEFG